MLTEPTPSSDVQPVIGETAPPSPPIIVLADDLAGALEMAEVALRHGRSAVVQTEFQPVVADVICLDLGIRWMTPQAAERHLGEVLALIARAPLRWLFLRIDPRHLDRAEILLTATLSAWVWTRALVVPINPGRGETMHDGCLHGMSGGDPTWVTLAERLQAAAVPVLLPNIAGPQDLARLSTRIDHATLLAGSAELFALRLVRYGTDRLTRPGIRRLRRCRLVVSEQAYDQTAGQPCHFSINTPSALVQAALSDCHVAVIAGADVRQPYADRLARLVREVVDQRVLDHLLLPANEIGRQVLVACGWSRLLMCRAFGDGVVEMAANGPYDPTVLFKPESSSWPRKLHPDPSGSRSA